ncbi:hypothetical protein IIV30_075L [Invertebrate iridescent virus 30]|uniref:Uncharacterized protein n=1 Tax=Invertebrate iridescent virus 30 TaxID=345585 RepID=W8W2I6_9VIRU|nr:hypothetical protein IIV30_075L [Invertebrate iridescent virus 30]CCV02270.1 hypothetical protein IIV30_075L [Invertebrate iridescent virus 30]
MKKHALPSVKPCNNHIIKIEQICLVNSTLKTAKKNLKKLEKVMVELESIDYKKLKLGDTLTTIYYEVWFMFINEIICIQKHLIEYFVCLLKNKPQPLPNNEIVDKINLLCKPIFIQILNFKPPHIKLCVPQNIYNEF